MPAGPSGAVQLYDTIGDTVTGYSTPMTVLRSGGAGDGNTKCLISATYGYRAGSRFHFPFSDFTFTSASEILNRNVFHQERRQGASRLKTSDKFDIYSPEGELLMLCREPNIGAGDKLQRFLGGNYDKNSSFDFVMSLPETNEQVLPGLAQTRVVFLQRTAGTSSFARPISHCAR